MHNHVIRKCVLEFNFTKSEAEEYWHHSVREICYSRIMPLINKIFNSLDIGGKTLLIDNLILDLGRIEYHDLRKNPVGTILFKIEEVLKSIMAIYESELNIMDSKLGQYRVKDIETRIKEAFLYFLDQGHLPWWISDIDWKDFEEMVSQGFKADPPKEVDKLIKLLQDRPILIHRLVSQFSFQVIGKILNRLVLKARERNLNIIRQLISSFEMNQKIIMEYYSKSVSLDFIDSQLKGLHFTRDGNFTLYESSFLEYIYFIEELDAIFPEETRYRSKIPTNSKLVLQDKELMAHKIDLLIAENDLRMAEAIEHYITRFSRITKMPQKDLIDKIKPKLPLKEKLLISKDTTATERPYSTEDKMEDQTYFNNEEIYIENSGLIILHTYFITAFNNLGFLEKQIFKGYTEQVRAVLFLQYMATGERQTHEHDVVLNKCIAGIPVSKPLGIHDFLKKSEKEEADKILLSVIENWHALKNTSIEGLREAFLQRSGKLIFKDDHITLNVESQSHDILLAQLPWTISAIKFPWIEKLIYVNWF